MKINEVRELSTSELKENVITVRKDIARVNLVLRERELEAEAK